MFQNSAASLLERKILQFEEMIAEFPEGFERVADKFRDKVIVLWQRLASGELSNQASNLVTSPPASTSVMPAPVVSSAPVSKMLPAYKVLLSWNSLSGSPNSSSFSTTYKKQLKHAESSESKSNPKKSNKQQEATTQTTPQVPKSPLLATPITIPPCNDIGGDEPSQLSLAMMAAEAAAKAISNSASTSNLTGNRGKPSGEDFRKQAFRTSMESSLAELADIQSGADVDAVKHLLTECAKAQRQLSVFGSDSRLPFEVFTMAFRKLPSKMREQFLTIYGVRQNGINLKNLIAFLQAEIVAQHSKTVWLLSMLAAKSKEPNNFSLSPSISFGTPSSAKKMSAIGPVAPKWNSSGNSAVYCKYCKSQGHTPAGCQYIAVSSWIVVYCNWFLILFLILL